MKYKTILIDIDDTLLDFQKSEDLAIRTTIKTLGIDPTEELVNKYKEINLKYWKMFERGEIEREALLIARFKEFCEIMNITHNDFSTLNDTYFYNLSSVPFEIDGAEDFLKRLSKHYNIYAVTNGVKRVQTKRLSLVNITKYLKKIYISEEIGFQKPNVEYFDYVLKDLQITNKEEVLIIGDSLTSDIQGGINSNIDTMWYNPKGLKSNIKYTYKISKYEDFFKLIEA